MRRPLEVWRRYLWLWLLPLVFCLLNLIVLVIYPIGFAGKIEDLHDNLTAATTELEVLEGERIEAESFLDRVDANRDYIELLYAEHFSTEAERFTAAVQEVKRLARQSGLDPTALSYPQSDLDDYALSKRDVVFRVEGNYSQLRTFINFIELSEQFLTLEQVSLSSAMDRNSARLGINLMISTIFVDPQRDPKSTESGGSGT